MDLFDQLDAAVRRQNGDGELPDFIVPRLLQVVAERQRYAAKEALLRRLLTAVDEYEPISNVSCEKVGYDLRDLERLLGQLQGE